MTLKKDFKLIAVNCIVLGILGFLACQHINKNGYDVDVAVKAATIFSGFAGSFLSLYVMLLLVEQHKNTQLNLIRTDKENRLNDLMYSTTNVIDKFSIDGGIMINGKNTTFRSSGNLAVTELGRLCLQYGNQQNEYQNNKSDNVPDAYMHFNDSVILRYLKLVENCINEVDIQITSDKKIHYYKLIQNKFFIEIDEIHNTLAEFKKIEKYYDQEALKLYRTNEIMALISALRVAIAEKTEPS